MSGRQAIGSQSDMDLAAGIFRESNAVDVRLSGVFEEKFRGFSIAAPYWILLERSVIN